MTDAKFIFDQVYHEYFKYTLKNQKYAYDKLVLQKVCSLTLKSSGMKTIRPQTILRLIECGFIQRYTSVDMHRSMNL